MKTAYLRWRKLLGVGIGLGLLVAIVALPALGASRQVATHRPVPARGAAERLNLVASGARSAAVPGATFRSGAAVAIRSGSSLASARRLAATASQIGSAADWVTQNPLPTAGDLADVHFVSALVGWAAADDTVIKTVDGGVTWNRQDVGVDNYIKAIDFVDANHGWAVGDGGVVLRTTDGGETWLPAYPPGDVAGLTSVSFVDQSVGYAVSVGEMALKTTDGGVTWKPLLKTNNYSPEAVHFVSRTVGWIVGDYGQIMKTTDGGDSWTSQGDLLPDDGSYTSVYFLNASVGWVTSDHAILRTVNGGVTWQRTEVAPMTSSVSGVRFVDAGHGWATAVRQVIDPVPSVGIPMVGVVLRTDDGGATWAEVDLGREKRPTAVSFTDPDHGYVVGSGYPGCVLESTSDGGKTWTSLVHGSTAGVADVSATGTSTAIASCRDGSILRTIDGGSTWETRTTDTTQTLWALASAGASETWAVGDEGVIRHTADAGDTWETQDSGTTAWLGSASFVDAQHGWAAGADGTLLKTVDGGAHWAAVSSAPAYDLYSVVFVDQHTGWVAPSGGAVLFKTTDGGDTWTAQNPSCLAGELVDSVDFADALHGWAVSGGVVARTSDGGATWTEQFARTDGILLAVHAIDANSAVAVSSQAEIVRTDDGGQIWWRQRSADVYLSDIDFADSATGWAVGQGGLIIKTTDGGGSQPALASLEGTIRSAVNHKPLSGVQVTMETYPTVVTDSAGHYRIPNIVPGVYDWVSLYKPGYGLGNLGWEAFDAGDQQTDEDGLLLAKSGVKFTSMKIARRRFSVGGSVAPARKTTVTLRFEKLVGKKYVHVRDAKVASKANGRFSYSHALTKGTWRVRSSVAAGKGYMTYVSAWSTLKVK
jgi:photosystem II stability/assembly factor-like uncharacterized protein